ncbi:unnamed protein product [Fraxinus pennsylvanica]|uniref:Uncharacterized protein n=1 Tax=Fraxinus pennsylvanica TaxID=56036 RepID=A0AAD2A8R4_9LAMI|nr:unnamed protein product [Fraxinus pennsylvanica]
MKWNESFLVIGTQFTGGVFLGNALMHLLSDSNETFGDLTEKEYPFAFMLPSARYLLTMLADFVISYVYGKKKNNFDPQIQGISFFSVLWLFRQKLWWWRFTVMAEDVDT